MRSAASNYEFFLSSKKQKERDMATLPVEVEKMKASVKSIVYLYMNICRKLTDTCCWWEVTGIRGIS